jgi:hypothetical protein
VAAKGIEALAAGVLEEYVKDPGVVVKEVGAGRIRDTSLDAYSFAFLKNSVISAKGQAYEEPTFSQSTSSPRNAARAIAPSTPHLTKLSSIARTGSLMVSKAATSF